MIDLARRIYFTALLAAHGLGAAAWWWFLPGGFPVLHPRFWSNRALPAALIVLVAAAIVARAGRRPVALALLAAPLAAMWLGLAGGSVAFFTTSGPKPAAVMLLVFLGAAAGLFILARQDLLAARRLAIVVSAIGVAVGFLLPLTQRGGEPSTLPLDIPPVAATEAPDEPPSMRAIRFNEHAMVEPGGTASLTLGQVMINLEPLLTFESISPDRCWTIFAPPDLRHGAERRVLSAAASASGLTALYRDAGLSRLVAQATDDRGSMLLEATTTLDEPVYSHLNAYTYVAIAGHRGPLRIAFSPCPHGLCEFMPSDYPVGRPLRVAYLDGEGMFHVVEASSGEKGPFRELARGPLARHEPLTMTLADQDGPICRIVLEDWAAQAGTDASPTAGWGLPVNAIEFSRYGDAPESPCAVAVTLSGTSVGRGWDSVGHAAGTYRNRMKVEALRPSTPATAPAVAKAP